MRRKHEKKNNLKNQINQQATPQMTKKKQHQTCMHENKTPATVNKCKEKTKTARTQTKVHDNRPPLPLAVVRDIQQPSLGPSNELST